MTTFLGARVPSRAPIRSLKLGIITSAATVLAAAVSAATVPLAPVAVDVAPIQNGENKMISPEAVFMNPASKLGMDSSKFQLGDDPAVTSITLEGKTVWVGAYTELDGTKKYSLVVDGADTQVKDGPATTWSREYTAFTIPTGEAGKSIPLHVRAIGNPPVAMRYFVPSYNEGQWTPEGIEAMKVAVTYDGQQPQLLLDLDGDDAYRFKSPTMEVREFDKPFKLQGKVYNPTISADGKSISFTETTDADAPELAVLRFGAPAPDWPAKDFDGKAVKLSDYRGKFVFFDVWATWCGPCLGEIPHIQEAQDKYGDKVTIIGVSIDGDMELPKKMAADKKMTYTQLWTPDEFQSVVCKQYQVNGIPSTFLVDPEGKLVTSGLRGDSISQALEMALKYDTPEGKQYFAETTERAEAFQKVDNLVESGGKSEAIALLKALKQKHKDPEGLKSLDRYIEYLEK